jgi:Predicted membrane protein
VMGWYGGGMGWMMLTSSILGLALIGLVVWAIVRVTSPSEPRERTAQASARDILDRRFAAGEIDVETYRAAVRELSMPGR